MTTGAVPSRTESVGAPEQHAPGAEAPSPLLRVCNLRVHFPVRAGLLQRITGWVKAVEDVTFDIAPGEALGLVGESGSGKTTVGRTVLGLVRATSGVVLFDGRRIVDGPAVRLSKADRRHAQIVFQDPGGSLNPRLRVGTIVGEPLEVHRLARRGERTRRVAELLERVGLWSGAAERFPHEFSGGQKQRIAIARALALNPHLLVLDEPTSALDVSVQAQILNLLADLRRDLGLAYLFISHNLAVVDHLCDRIAVMRQGRIVEIGPREQVIDSPRHEYTRALLRAVPVPDPRRRMALA